MAATAGTRRDAANGGACERLYEAQREMVARWLLGADEEAGVQALPSGGRDEVARAARGDATAWRALVTTVRLPSSDDDAKVVQQPPPARVVAYSRACMLAADTALLAPTTTATAAAGVAQAPLYHTLEEDAEDAAGCAPPSYEDAAADIEALRWRNATRSVRVTAVRKAVELVALPFALQPALVRTPEAMASFVRLTAAARQQCEGAQSATAADPPSSPDCDCALEHQDASVSPCLTREDREGMLAGAGFCPEITHMAAGVPDLPPPQPCRAALLARPAGMALRAATELVSATARLLAHSGFGDASRQALDVLADVTGAYIRKLCLTMRTRFDNLETRTLTLREVNRAMRDMGLRGITSLRHYFDSVCPPLPSPPPPQPQPQPSPQPQPPSQPQPLHHVVAQPCSVVVESISVPKLAEPAPLSAPSVVVATPPTATVSASPKPPAPSQSMSPPPEKSLPSVSVLIPQARTPALESTADVTTTTTTTTTAVVSGESNAAAAAAAAAAPAPATPAPQPSATPAIATADEDESSREGNESETAADTPTQVHTPTTKKRRQYQPQRRKRQRQY